MEQEKTIVLQPDEGGNYVLKSVLRADIQKIDISDIDLVVTTKGGEHFLLPRGGIAAMSEHSPNVVFSDGPISASQLLGEVGAVLNLAIEGPMPSSINHEGDKHGDNTKTEHLAKEVHKLQQQTHQEQQHIKEQQQKIEQLQRQIQEHQKHDQDQQKQHDQDQRNVSKLTVDTEGTVEQMVQNLEKMEENLHKSDYEYVPPHQFESPPTPPAPAGGVTPPISLTPIVSLSMGNVVGTTIDTNVNPGYTTYYGGGGAVGSDATAQIGPRDALQFSAATISGDNGNDIIYAEGPSVGNTNPAVSNSTYYAKQFLLSVAGYFTTLNDITIKGVPTGVSIVGATNNGGGVWTLPASYVLKQNSFTLVYDTSTYNSAANNVFNLEFDISGNSTRHVTFQSTQTFRFEYLNVTDVSQVTNPTLVYDDKGNSKEIYVLPVLDQPNIITAGDGNDIVYGSRSNDTITLGNGNDQITEGNGNNTIVTGSGNSTIMAGNGVNNVTVGNGTNTISLGNGNNIVLAGTGSDTITTGSGNDSITVGGGGGAINAGAGNNTITINSANGSTHSYTISTSGAGTNSITGGDDNYAVTTGAGTNTVSLGNSTSTGDGTTTFDTTISTGAGISNITVGNGVHSITVAGGSGTISTLVGNNKIQATASGNYTISTGAGNNNITTVGGGGSITTAQGNNSIAINSAGGSTNAYALNMSGTGTTNIAAGDDNYTVIAATSGANTISIGSGTSSITATTGVGLDSVTTGNGNMTVAVGDGAGDTVTIGSGTTVANTIAASVGNGAGDTVTTYGSSASTGTIAIGTGSGDVINAGLGNLTITVGGSNGVTNTMALTAGAGDNVTVGNGSNTIYLGSHASGIDSVTLGNGNNTVYVGTGTNTITGGTGTNTLNFSNITSALTIAFGTTGTSAATAAGISDSFTNFSTIYGTNQGDTITLNTGTLAVFAGSGNDTITLGSGAETVNAGNGNNTITGANLTTTTGDTLIGGTGNNTFLSPNAGTTYNGTNSADLSPVANNVAYIVANTTATDPFANATNVPVNVVHSYAGGVSTVNLDFQVQINKINYSSDNSGLTINLASGTGSGGTAQSSVYGGTATSGYDSINGLVLGNGINTLTPSFSDTILIGGTGRDIFNDTNTINSQNVILVGGGATSGGNVDAYNLGAAHEIIVGSTIGYDQVVYSNSPAGIVANFDSISHTFSNTLYGTAISVSAYSGSNWGANAANSSSSWSTGDYYVPVAGSGTSIDQILGSQNSPNLVYAGSSNLSFFGGNSTDYVYGGSGILNYSMSNGNDVFVGGAGLNVFNSASSFNTYVIFSKALDPRSQDANISLTSGGATYTEFAYGWNNATTAGSNYTLMSNVENVAGGAGSDYIVGDNNGNQINARTGSNTIIEGSGTNIITLIEGSNTLTSTGTHNTLNFETSNDSFSGSLGSYSTAATSGVEVFIGNTTGASAFFNTGTGGDQAAFWGGTSFSGFQVRTGASGSYSYSSVQSGITQTINGGNYAAGVTDTAANSTFTYDSVYYGDANAQSIRGHGGNSVLVGDGGADSLYGGTGSNAYYVTSTQLASVAVFSGSSGVDILRVPGWGAAVSSGNAFGVDPFSNAVSATNTADNAKFVSIDVIDVRRGADTVNTTNLSVTFGAGSTANATAPTFNLNALDVQNLNDKSNTSTVTLKLDSGDVFTGLVGAGTGALTVLQNPTHTATDTTYRFYSDAGHGAYNTTNLVATVNVHFGTG